MVTAVAAAVSLTCAACGLTWDVMPKPDGSMPQGARCPVALGGCGKFARVPRAALTRPLSALPASVAAGGWDPPGKPRRPYETAEACPGCGSALWASARGTLRGCLACQAAVIPPGVAAPYERGGGKPARQVRSQRERDAERRDVAERKAVLAGQLRRLLEAGNFDDGSAGRVESYLDDVRAAETMARLDELVEEFRGERLRKRGWFGGRVTGEIEAPGDGQDDDQDDDDEDQDDDDRGYPPAIQAAPPPAIDYPAELAIRHYQVNRDAPPGQCQITELRPPAYPEGGPAACGAAGLHALGGARLCQGHRDALSRPMAGQP